MRREEEEEAEEEEEEEELKKPTTIRKPIKFTGYEILNNFYILTCLAFK